jgi:hypothetical protein
VREVRVEKELIQLRGIVDSVIPESLQLQAVDVVVGTLYQGQAPSFKAVVRVREKYEDPRGTAGWVYELGERVRAFWNRDDLYLEVHETAAEPPE